MQYPAFSFPVWNQVATPGVARPLRRLSPGAAAIEHAPRLVAYRQLPVV